MRLVLVLLLGGCAGDVPPGTAPDVDAPAQGFGQKLSGHVLDYFAGGNIPSAAITTDGITPVKMTTSGLDGTWELDAVPLGSRVFLSAAHPAFRTTRNVPVAVTGDLEQDLFAIAETSVQDQYTAMAALPISGTGIIIAEIRDAAGPLENIPTANVKLLDAANAVVPNLQVAFFGATDVDPAQTMATAFGGRSRVALLDVPPGNYTLKVSFMAAGVPVSTTAPVVATADGAVLALTKP